MEGQYIDEMYQENRIVVRVFDVCRMNEKGNAVFAEM